MGRLIPYMENKIHVPNHQPAMYHYGNVVQGFSSEITGQQRRKGQTIVDSGTLSGQVSVEFHLTPSWMKPNSQMTPKTFLEIW